MPTALIATTGAILGVAVLLAAANNLRLARQVCQLAEALAAQARLTDHMARRVGEHDELLATLDDTVAGLQVEVGAPRVRRVAASAPGDLFDGGEGDGPLYDEGAAFFAGEGE